MNFEPTPEHTWDEIDLYDREAASIRGRLKTIDLHQWVMDLYTLDLKLFERLKQEINSIPVNYNFSIKQTISFRPFFINISI